MKGDTKNPLSRRAERGLGLRANGDQLRAARSDPGPVTPGLPSTLALAVTVMAVILAHVVTVLPADALASVILAVALIAILSDALIAELSLGAVAIAGKLALPFAAAQATVLALVLSR